MQTSPIPQIFSEGGGTFVHRLPTSKRRKYQRGTRILNFGLPLVKTGTRNLQSSLQLSFFIYIFFTASDSRALRQARAVLWYQAAKWFRIQRNVMKKNLSGLFSVPLFIKEINPSCQDILYNCLLFSVSFFFSSDWQLTELRTCLFVMPKVDTGLSATWWKKETPGSSLVPLLFKEIDRSCQNILYSFFSFFFFFLRKARLLLCTAFCFVPFQV